MLTLTGGAIGQGLPVAVGAATACPDRPVLALCGDGSAMYTIQALYTIAREGLDVTTIINNRSYGILNIEVQRVGAETIGPEAKAQLDLSEPAIDFVSMAQGMGVPARRVARAEDFNTALENAFSSRGPFLIDAIVRSEYEGLKLKALPHMLNALGTVPSPVAKAIKKEIAPVHSTSRHERGRWGFHGCARGYGLLHRAVGPAYESKPTVMEALGNEQRAR